MLIVVRHSERDQSDPNHLKNSNVAISNNGIILAIEKAAELGKHVYYSNLKIITSPLKRTIQTATLFNQTLNITHEPFTQDYRIIEGMNNEPFLSDELIENMQTHDITYPESNLHIKERIKSFLTDILANNENVILFTHGIIYNYILQYFFPKYQFDEYWDVKKGNPTTYFPPYCACTAIDMTNKNILWSNIIFDY